MSNKKKLIVFAVTMMLAVILSTALVSFSLAGDGLADSGASATKVDNDVITSLVSENLADSLTNIDHIIEKALDTSLDDNDRVFRIVQIVSNGKTDTAFKKYVDDGYFRTHVINANKSADTPELPETITLASGAVSPISIDVVTVADMQAMVSATTKDYSRISTADLIYVTNDPSNPFATDDDDIINNDNDIPQDIYNVLHTYADGDDKPLIIDWSNGSSGSAGSAKTMENLASNVFENNYIKYRTYEWKSGVSLENFLNRTESVYIPLNIKEADHDSKILFVSGDGNASDMFDAVYVSLMNDNIFKENAYYRKGYMPKYFTPEKIKYTDIKDASFADGYDFVFIENDTYDSMTDDIYDALSAVSYAKKHVIYAGDLASSKGSNVDTKSNYYTLLGIVASLDGISLKSNVYLSAYTLFDSMVANPTGTQEAANEIAKLLMSSTYREYGKDSAAGKKYTVLEIQPAYPIDAKLAAKNEIYYTVPSNVYKKSKEMTPEGGEYYAFELTIEKVMAMTGLREDQINLVQVSTEELQGMKTSLSDKYDLIYIGGNTSALTNEESYGFADGTKVVGNYGSIELATASWVYGTLGQWKVGDVIPASDSVDGIEHIAEADTTQTEWVYALDYKNGATIPADKTVDGVEHKVEQQWTTGNIGYMVDYVFNDSWTVGQVIKAEDSVDGQEHTVANVSFWSAADQTNVSGVGYQCDVVYFVDASWNVGDTVTNDKTGKTHTIKKFDANMPGYKAYKVGYKKRGDGDYAFYGMYSHTGANVRLFNGLYGSDTGSYAAAGGNDITVNILNNLKSYVDAGMPLVLSDDVTDAYTSLANFGSNIYRNRTIDPDSNMYKFLVYAMEQQVVGGTDAPTYTVKPLKNVLTGFDKDDVIAVPNMEGTYGKTLTSYAVVFNDGALVPDYTLDKNGDWVEYAGDENPNAGNAAETAGAKIKALIKGSNARPTMNLTGMPKIYVANTPSSYLTEPKLKYEFEIDSNGNTAIQSYTVTLYIDDNSNGLFTDKGEDVKSVTVSVESGVAKGALEYSLSSDFFGPVSWKIEAVANEKQGTTLVATSSISYSAVSKVDRTTQEKQLVRLLQIMPDSKGEGQQSSNTLYFCTECQLANQNAKYNIQSIGMNSIVEVYSNYESVQAPTDKFIVDEENGHYGIGLHEHKFGIWQYDKGLDYDDWHSNLANALTGEDGDFEFEIDIMTPEMIDAMNSTCSNNAIAKMQKEYEDLKAKGADADTLKEKKDAITKASNDILTKAADLKEAYNNAVALTERYELDLRNVITYFKDHLDELEGTYGFVSQRLINPNVFADVLRSKMYYDIFSNRNTKWKGDEPFTYLDNTGRKGTIDSKAKDTAIVFEAEGIDEAGQKTEKIYKLGHFCNLTKIIRKSDNKEIAVADYVAAGGSLDLLDYDKYTYVYDTNIKESYNFINTYYQKWSDAKSAEILILNDYWDTVRSAYGKDWMKEVYGMVIIGAADEFNNNDLSTSVCATLVDYEKSGGNMLMFHDTLSKKTSGSAPLNLTAALREPFGLDRFHMELADDGTTYKVKAGYDPEKYFMTTINYLNPVRSAAKANLQSVVGKKNAAALEINRTLVGVSSSWGAYLGGMSTGMYENPATYVNYGGTAQVSMPYKYASFRDDVANFYMRDIITYQTNMASGNYGTNRATQLNNGIITSYPFNIASTLNISGTHNQYFSLDIEDDEVITWYTLAGANNKHEGSSMYAADPGDASDNYFIYSKGNVSYCGAGHAKVTGPYTDNNDERMLFINIICNSARKRAIEPTIKIYDPDKKKPVPSAGNKYILINSDGEPYIEVGSQEELIRFGFLATVDTTASETIEKTRIFFRYADNNGKMVDEVVASYPSTAGNPSLTSGVEYYMNTNDTSKNKLGDSIKLKPEYFNGYEDCAYVYIEVTDSNGDILLEKIRIDLVRDLFDMT